MATAVQTLLDDGGNEIMQTVADYWIEQGIEQGVEQGKIDTARRIARQLLAHHDLVTVSELTGLSIEEVKRLQKIEDKQ